MLLPLQLQSVSRVFLLSDAEGRASRSQRYPQVEIDITKRYCLMGTLEQLRASSSLYQC